MDIAVSTRVLALIREEAHAALPRECCGILLGEGVRIASAQPARNVHSAPETHFEIDPQALIDAHRAARDGGPQVLGYYHSHPEGTAEPSATDRAMAAGDGAIWAIVAQEKIAFFRASPEGFVPLAHSLADG